MQRLCVLFQVLDLCQVPEKLNIKIRANKEPLADHALWHNGQATADASPHVADTDYKN